MTATVGPARIPGRRTVVDGVRRRRAAAPDAELGELLRDQVAETHLLADDVSLAQLERTVSAELSGAGPLEPFLALSGTTDVLVNGPDEVWIERGRGLERAPVHFPDEAAVRRLAQRLAASAGRRLDDASPFVDAALPDGTRLHAVLPPMTRRTTVSLRVLSRRRFTLEDLVAEATMPGPVAELLDAVIAARLTFVVSGGTGTGKTTLLGALVGRMPARERVLVIEDSPELSTDHPHVVALTTRPANVEGAGAVGLTDLVRQALRMRPDRLVVGEFRGAELADLLLALNTGHEGGGATVHANSAADLPARLVALGSLGGLSRQAVISQLGSAVDVCIHLRRDPEGRRRVEEIGLVDCTEDAVVVVPVWQQKLGVLGGAPRMRALLEARDVSPPQLLW